MAKLTKRQKAIAEKVDFEKSYDIAGIVRRTSSMNRRRIGQLNEEMPEAAAPLADSDGDGVFEAILELESGRHEYKFIVDGVWKVDPANPERVRNNYGQLNSILVVPADVG